MNLSANFKLYVSK